jgi:hypothetical protein
MAVTLINVFRSPVGKEDEFVTWWHDVRRTSQSVRDSSAGCFIKVSNRRVGTTSSILHSGNVLEGL